MISQIRGATHSENIVANKYDTLAVEAAYLAHGQSMRFAELKQVIAPTAPLGQALMEKRVDDELDWQINQRKESYSVMAIE
jgi:transcription elongation GreA/GreB family factor